MFYLLILFLYSVKSLQMIICLRVTTWSTSTTVCICQYVHIGHNKEIHCNWEQYTYKYFTWHWVIVVLHWQWSIDISSSYRSSVSCVIQDVNCFFFFKLHFPLSIHLDLNVTNTDEACDPHFAYIQWWDDTMLHSMLFHRKWKNRKGWWWWL